MALSDPIAPYVMPETEAEWETRSQFRRDLLDKLDELLIAAEHTVEGGSEDGVKVVTHKAWIEILRATEFAPLPAIDRHYAEVVTGANVTVWATCPRCGIPGVINLQIDPELRVDTSGAELRLKAKAKPRTHMCGQLTIPALGPEVEGQESLNLEDMIGPRCELQINDANGDVTDEVCHLPEGHEGDCAPDPAEEIVPGEDLDIPEQAEAYGDPDAATPAETLAKTPEQAASDVSTKRARRRRTILEAVGPDLPETYDDLLPGELRCEGSVHIPGCEHFDQPASGPA